jgi:hypothetical protein
LIGSSLWRVLAGKRDWIRNAAKLAASAAALDGYVVNTFAVNVVMNDMRRFMMANQEVDQRRSVARWRNRSRSGLDRRRRVCRLVISKCSRIGPVSFAETIRVAIDKG